MSKYVAFDIETLHFAPDENRESADWRLGVTCAATITSDEKEPRIWWDQNPLNGEPLRTMDRYSLQHLVMWLNQKHLNGYKIVTYAGLGFDWRVVDAESELHKLCKHLAYNHIDMFFHVFCRLGYGPGLRAVSSAMSESMGGLHKMDDMDGKKAVESWPAEAEKIMQYVGIDAQVTLALAQAVDQEHGLRWISKRGKLNQVRIDNWMTVAEAMQLPVPAPGRLQNPRARGEFYGWLNSIISGPHNNG